MLKLSLIIPTFNEERHIKACLDAVKNQTVKPHEVIVVDNNCTDKTLEIAEQYDFVKIVKESRQGRGYARNAGFNAATGDVLGRIDADSQIHDTWVERVLRHFGEDAELSAVTGLSYTPVVPILKWPKSTFFSRAYYWHVHGFFGTVTTWGANMAVRKTAWNYVKDDVCLDDKAVHEDQDIALWLAGKSLIIRQTNDLHCTAYNQSFRYLPKMLYYIRLRSNTRIYHLKAGNLPAPEAVRISNVHRIGSYMFSVPVLFYGLILGIIMLPLDWYMVQIRKNIDWFS